MLIFCYQFFQSVVMTGGSCLKTYVEREQRKTQLFEGYFCLFWVLDGAPHGYR